jgi:hypothetical protein
MNRQQLRSALASATASTFEGLALLYAAPDVDAGQRAAPLAAGVRLDFTGPFAGAVVVRTTADVLAAAAANMLGAGGPPPEPLRRDALGELANVICGNLLPAVAGRAVFDLGAPRWTGVAPADAALGAPVAEVRLGLEGGRAEVALHLVAGAGARVSRAGAAERALA